MSRNSKFGHIHNFGVDLPLNPNFFNTAIANVIPRVPHYVNKNVSCKVTIEEMTKIFGPKWNIVQSKCTSTQARIIGLVKVHFRLKNLKIQRHIEPG